MKNTKNKEPKDSIKEFSDFSDDLNEGSQINTSERNRELDQEILRSGEEIAGLSLRRISAGDLAMLIECGVGLVMGRMNSVAFDVGAILFCQSSEKDEVRKLSARPQEFRAAVYDFLDTYEADVFTEATPRILELVERMNKSKTAVSGTASGHGGGESADPKAGGRAG
jgi:hypothetical protein